MFLEDVERNLRTNSFNFSASETKSAIVLDVIRCRMKNVTSLYSIHMKAIVMLKNLMIWFLNVLQPCVPDQMF